MPRTPQPAGASSAMFRGILTVFACTVALAVAAALWSVPSEARTLQTKTSPARVALAGTVSPELFVLTTPVNAEPLRVQL